ncbi:Prolyl tripeptidyl peptidase precursor [Rosistilla carotiformis]|uniref:Prolyl tripeptidyl peptidase n=1 Tax=Rosistilla carotiformis TaxID=2528017 RepID=A0A518JSB4_9BACT|nr:S9 family peptidase [Rosistilla carotiformis]QDV68417.1 Prolyl tripeptidyl peptidase precursor [Rosistilla carotiformis]
MTSRFAYLGLLAALCLHVAVASAKSPDAAKPALLSVDQIYGSSEFSSRSFSGDWLPEGHRYTKRLPTSDGSSDKGIVAIDASDKHRDVLVPAGSLIPAGQTKPLDVASFSFSADQSRVLIFTNTRRVWRRHTRGDYWVLDRSARTLKKLGGDRPESTLMFAKFSPDGQSVAWVHERNIYVESLLTGEIRQVTKTASDKIINGTADWVNEEELGIRDGFRWSPDGSRIAYWQFDTTGVPTMTMINNTRQMYPQTITFPYPKTGQQNSACRVGVVDIKTAETKWIELGDPRQHYIARIMWAPRRERRGDREPVDRVAPPVVDTASPDDLVLQEFNRLQNENRVIVWDVDSNRMRTALTETDAAWVDVHDEMFWLDDATRFTWISERDGWRRVYLASRDGQALVPITPEGIDAIELLGIDEAQGLAYVIASPENATQRYLYTASLTGNQWKRLTPADQPGTHRYQLSADRKFAFHTYATLNTPPQTDLISLPDHQRIEMLESNDALRKKLAKRKLPKAELFRVAIEDGVEFDAWCINPPDHKPRKRYPLLIYVYGEPAGTTVHDRWGGSSFLWHQMLAQQGYVVISIDNRGTPQPRGRDWRKSIYRKIGINAPQDQAASVRQILKDRKDIDPDRVGIWGWSGGGSMSLCAIFKFPDLYKTAIAIAPVPNHRYYDTIYQERYMGLPSDNVDGYQEGSPITHAHKLEGNLLLIHGTGDDNCHYATSEMLINELIRHNKPFDMWAYPNRSHSISEGKNTTRHLRALMTRYLNDKLPAGGR